MKPKMSDEFIMNSIYEAFSEKIKNFVSELAPIHFLKYRAFFITTDGKHYVTSPYNWMQGDNEDILMEDINEDNYIIDCFNTYHPLANIVSIKFQCIEERWGFFKKNKSNIHSFYNDEMLNKLVNPYFE